MISLLSVRNKQRKGLMEQGSDAMPTEIITDNEGKYFSIIGSRNLEPADQDSSVG